MGTQKEIRRETTVKETAIETFTVNSNDNNKDLQKLLDECQNFHYAQSSKFSTLARTLVFGIIGTIWICHILNKVLAPVITAYYGL